MPSDRAMTEAEREAVHELARKDPRSLAGDPMKWYDAVMDATLSVCAQRVRETERREPDAMTPEEEEMALRSGEKKPPCHRCKGKVEWYQPRHNIDDCVKSLAARVTPEDGESSEGRGSRGRTPTVPTEEANARLLASNELLRSCFQVAKRENEMPGTTNWPPLVRQLDAELAAQHEITNRLRSYAQRVRETERREPEAMTPEEEEEMALRSGEKKPPCHKCGGDVPWYVKHHDTDDCIRSLAARLALASTEAQ